LIFSCFNGLGAPGFAISKAIVEALGSGVVFSPNADGGTTFYLDRLEVIREGAGRCRRRSRGEIRAPERLSDDPDVSAVFQCPADAKARQRRARAARPEGSSSGGKIRVSSSGRALFMIRTVLLVGDEKDTRSIGLLILEAGWG
jgi:hypothetical protein